MAQAFFGLPRGFLWGTATAAHQTEGTNTNNQWWSWEQLDGKILQGDRSGIACDWWNGRWREDFDRAANAGQNAHRFSVEWSRIQPAPDRWNEEALDHYLEMARGLQERKMTPLVTLHHFSNPQWVEDMGGWENLDVANLFGKFAGKVVDALQDYVSYWVTINEPNVYAFNSYLLGDFPPGKKDLATAVRVLANMVRGHAAAYHIIHQIQPTARVGIAHHYRGVKAKNTWSPLDRIAANLMNDVFNEAFPRAIVKGSFQTSLGKQKIPEAKNTQDYLGLNYYTRDLAAFSFHEPGFLQRSFNPGTVTSKSGMIANEPEGMFEMIKWGLKFQVPILITENGIDDGEDLLRPSYLALHIHQMWRAVNFNYPVKGYFHWTLVDNFEWERGWSQRFGLWELDVETQARKKRPSADFYAEICLNNGLSGEATARYAPEVFQQLFPN